MNLHREVHFESELCAELAAAGWLHDEGAAARYDRARALFPDDVVAWVRATQPEAWAALEKGHGGQAAELLLDRLRAQLEARGTLDVLHAGIELLGVRRPITLVQFKPAFGLNPELLERYAQNRLRVVRQVRYSLQGESSLDLALFLNGLPVATVELKSDFTQRVDDAVDQYRFDREPQPKGRAREPLLSFPGGALVHFAVSHAEVRMTTRLEGARTRFLPFNRGDRGGAGNPPLADGGPRTAWLWREVWQRDSWLEIVGRYLVGRRDKKQQLAEVIFPRYHQLDATRRLQAAVLRDGPGARYLIQHSAGSGKTKSIAWTAHLLSELHDAASKKVFDSVLVVSDRNVIDSQLQDELDAFARKSGVVATIRGEGGSKSAELAEALSGTKKIVACTIQTFPHALQAVRELAATQGKRFAVIADEAHSSQTGEAAAKLKAVLSAAEQAELADGGEVAAEDVLTAQLSSQMTARAADRAITFVAFTATPKAKTLELFGTRPDPARPPAADNVPAPFHVYSMRQAIEEGFILDVLRNYTPWSLAFKLAHRGEELNSAEVERSAALKRLMGWVRLHPYNIAQKVQVVVEHFRAHVAPLLIGKAKAMVVVASRVEAVRWQLAIEQYVAAQRYPIGTLVAFSGEVIDLESHPDPLTEQSTRLNPKLNGRDLREAFKGDDYQILLAANKFQTGFDQPLLCGMYVDKRLAGVQAVQTLSRLNRAHEGKTTTYVLDFVNDPEEVLAAFKPYYETAALAGTTDPNLVFDLRAKLDGSGCYEEAEVERVVRVELDPNARQGELIAALEPVADRLLRRHRAAGEARRVAQARHDAAAEQAAKDEQEALQLFKADAAAYLRLYTFLSQIFDYGNTALEKRALFFKRLLPLLEFGREREGIDLSKVELTHHRLRDRGVRDLPLGAGDAMLLDPIAESGHGLLRERERAYLGAIIAKVNELFAGEITDQDKLCYVQQVIRGKLLESATLRQQAASNTKEQFAGSPDLDGELLNAILAAYDAHTVMSRQALDSESVRKGLRELLLQHGRLWELLREQGVPPAA